MAGGYPPSMQPGLISASSDLLSPGLAYAFCFLAFSLLWITPFQSLLHSSTGLISQNHRLPRCTAEPFPTPEPRSFP